MEVPALSPVAIAMASRQAASILLEAEGHLGKSAVLLDQVSKVSALAKEERVALAQLALQARTTRRTATSLMRHYALGVPVLPSQQAQVIT
ncbi:hypothetical protein FJV41_31305 [Myxococcus llanfairpwllgwyngyllgogerychwyrndrobwllllantysiliogogogochensis]|uniref:Uncharacterized protein n=1 Tax=Myxococcus llanfairpwllgwyngyllgogerychwyrndrobwllllantysiliogogogochensis TaxID=2590453 RepID=A0A540WSK7_9BACT|nr:hypothetical protein [Myxococcus llanfairpwllgwyngyllgogerychwyrndrobwllllantysiliogogogochensis]TQF12016.1 hypothetical protein FJV41_31305 [Myxococcus llanfairpwllgwyngyllgogerychwyrndrobwllllantysiliogogogochensis]